MLRPTRPGRGKRIASVLAVATASLLAPAGVALAAAGPQNPSFETGLGPWTAEILHEGDHAAVAVDACEEVAHDPKRTICVVSGDLVPVAGRSPIGVAPLDGTQMLRLGGPFDSEDEEQFADSYRVQQTFTVDPASPVLRLNYNVFAYEYQGFNELRFEVRLGDANGPVITDLAQRGIGTDNVGAPVPLKTTGWRSAFVDLTGYENEQVHLTVTSSGSQDRFYGFWAYLDAGEAPAPPVAPSSFAAAAPNPVTGGQVPVNAFPDPVTRQSFATLRPADAAAFPNGCVPLDVSVPIDGGGGVVSGVSLIASFYLKGIPMHVAAPGTWQARACASAGDLAVEYTVSKGGEEETMIVPVGGVAVTDPLGVVYDQARYDAAVAGGAAPAAARAAGALGGATVRLQRQVGGVFRNVLSGDPDVSPQLNPEVTGANGEFQWRAGAGTYRVVVSKPGYVAATSAAATLPGAGLHVGLTTPAPPPPAPPAGGGGTTPPAVVVPPAPTARKAPCAGLRGAKLAKCKRAQRLAKAIAACRRGKASRRALCIKRAKALSKCEAMSNRTKRRRCVAKARRIGRATRPRAATRAPTGARRARAARGPRPAAPGAA
jgi:hypothetical protein